MRIYATVASERAKKGQGGNDYLDITITLDSGIVVGEIELQPNNDKAGTWTAKGNIGPQKIFSTFETQTQAFLIPKGERQKGEVVYCEMCNVRRAVKGKTCDKCIQIDN